MQPKLALPLDSDLTSPGVARARAVELVTPWVSEVLAADTGLLITELVTNAVRHGGSRVLSVHPALSVCAEVFDSSFDLPVMRSFDVDSVSGRGMWLVDAIASSWGTRARLDGKVVWFELHESGAA
jgi:two-component sensor histidine kinase